MKHQRIDKKVLPVAYKDQLVRDIIKYFGGSANRARASLNLNKLRRTEITILETRFYSFIENEIQELKDAIDRGIILKLSLQEQLAKMDRFEKENIQELKNKEAELKQARADLNGN